MPDPGATGAPGSGDVAAGVAYCIMRTVIRATGFFQSRIIGMKSP